MMVGDSLSVNTAIVTDSLQTVQSATTTNLRYFPKSKLAISTVK